MAQLVSEQFQVSVDDCWKGQARAEVLLSPAQSHPGPGRGAEGGSDRILSVGFGEPRQNSEPRLQRREQVRARTGRLLARRAEQHLLRSAKQVQQGRYGVGRNRTWLSVATDQVFKRRGLSRDTRKVWDTA